MSSLEIVWYFFLSLMSIVLVGGTHLTVNNFIKTRRFIKILKNQQTEQYNRFK